MRKLNTGLPDPEGPRLCNRCREVEIEHVGVCDKCDAELRAESDQGLSIPEVLELRGIPQNLLGCSWEKFEETPEIAERQGLHFEIEKARNWRPSLGPWALVLTGPPGVGKTHVAVATLRRYVETTGRRKFRFLTEPRALRLVRQSYEPGAEDFVQELIDIELLVIDDLGSAKVSDWSVGVLVDVLTSRHAAGKGTVITTNHTLNDIAEMMDERLASRLAEGVRVSFPPVMGDYRLGEKGTAP